MIVRLQIITGFSVFLATVWFLSSRAVPGKGIMRFAEKMTVGAVLCFLCSACLALFGLDGPSGPLGALFSGYLGIPGAVLCSILSNWP